jgi:hypothetical protein
MFDADHSPCNGFDDAGPSRKLQTGGLIESGIDIDGLVAHALSTTDDALSEEFGQVAPISESFPVRKMYGICSPNNSPFFRILHHSASTFKALPRVLHKLIECNRVLHVHIALSPFFFSIAQCEKSVSI